MPLFAQNALAAGGQLVNHGTQNIFDSYCCEILDLADDITRSNIAKDIINVPHVIAAGDQSSGKSSVLGILSGIQLPTGDGTAVTKCAVQLAMRKKDKSSYSMIYPRNRRLSGPNSIPEEILKFQNQKKNSTFELAEMPSFRIESRETRNLTVVDLPGIFHSTTLNQDALLPHEVQETVRRHIQNPKCVILGVVDCTKDLALNTLFQLLREVDNEGSRTIIVFTKIDKIYDDKVRINELIKQVEDRQRHSFRNYVFVNSLKRHSEDESFFFKDIIARYSLPAECCGFDNLYRKVCSLLIDPMYKEFHTKWPQVEGYFDTIRSQCRALQDSITDRDKIVNRKLTKFIEQSRNALKCIYTSENGQMSDAQRMYSFYRQYFLEFNNEYKQKMEKCPQSLTELATDGRQQEMRGFSNWAAFKSVAVPIVTSFREPAAKCQLKVLNKNKDVLYSFINEYFRDHPQHQEFLRTKVDEIFEKQNSKLEKQLERVHECEKYLHVDDELQGKFGGILTPTGPVPVQVKLPERNEFVYGVLDSIHYTLCTLSAPILSTIRLYFHLMFFSIIVCSLVMLIIYHYAKDSFIMTLLEPFGYAINWAFGGIFTWVIIVSSVIFFVYVVKDIFHRLFINAKSSVSNSITDLYAHSLDLVKKLAAERLANVIPSNILLCLNEEAQQEIQTIDRYHEQLNQMEWETSEEELKLRDYQQRLKLFEEWKIRRQNVVEKHRRCTHLMTASHK